MNLNTLKRGFTKTNPEKGLRSLPGAQKTERRTSSPTIRVKGRYITQSTDRLGHFLGLLSYIHAWLYTILLPCSFLSDTGIFSPISVFILGFALVHGYALFADGLHHSEVPWARRALKIFWLSTLCLAMVGFVISMSAL